MGNGWSADTRWVTKENSSGRLLAEYKHLVKQADLFCIQTIDSISLMAWIKEFFLTILTFFLRSVWSGYGNMIFFIYWMWVHVCRWCVFLIYSLILKNICRFLFFAYNLYSPSQLPSCFTSLTIHFPIIKIHQWVISVSCELIKNWISIGSCRNEEIHIYWNNSYAI